MLLSFFTCKISYLWFQTQKNLKVAVHFHICILQNTTKFEAEVMRIKKSYQWSKKFEKLPKIKEKLTKFTKIFWKVSTFCYWLYFCVFSNAALQNPISTMILVDKLNNRFFKIVFLSQFAFFVPTFFPQLQNNGKWLVVVLESSRNQV